MPIPYARRILAIGACFVLLALPLSAQTHPCDTTPLVNPTIQTATPVAIGFCHASVDAAGNSTVLTSFRITVDGAQVFSGPLSPIGSPSASGFNYYETPKTITVSKGSHTTVEYASNSEGESVGSDPYAFTIKGLPPGKGKVHTVNK